MKNIIILIAVTLLVAGSIPETVFAKDHNGKAAAPPKHSICSVENCDKTGTHRHGGTVYTGHHVNDGHSYHRICGVEGCIQIGSHRHDETAPVPYTGNNTHHNDSDSSGNHNGNNEHHNGSGNHHGGHH